MGKPLIDLAGQTFEKLTVKERAEKRGKYTGAFWLCECECGNRIVVPGNDLRRGHRKSCGCTKGMSQRTTYEYRNTQLYRTWLNIKTRCQNPKAKGYDRYGGRGIKVCEEWKNDFMCFYKWAMENGYREGLTIDRKDNDGNYEPSNCRWITRKEQMNNYSRNHLITADGETHTIQEWSEITGIPATRIVARINVQGWDEEKAVKTVEDKRYRELQQKNR